MGFVCLFLGLMLGAIIGFLLFCAGQVQIERNAVEMGFVRLNGKYYEIREISKENDDEN